MDKKKVAILIDGGHLEKGIFRHNKLEAKKTYDFALKFLEADEDLFRIYYYDCYPYNTVVELPISKKEYNFGTSIVCKEKEAFLSAFVREDFVAIRKGRLAFHGWKLKNEAPKMIFERIKKDLPKKEKVDDLKIEDYLNDSDFFPDFEQKAVDIKIGMDVTWLASEKIVDRILLITADTDFIPAIKFARTQGVQVVFCRPKGKLLHSTLLEHADSVRSK